MFQSVFEELEKQGWTRRFTACEPRLSEAVSLYEEAGFEVRLEPLPAASVCGAHPGEEDPDGCRSCFEGFEGCHKVIFTRQPEGTH